MIAPRIETLPQKKLIGQKLTMSLTDNRTAQLWRSFMPRRKEIINHIGTEFYSLQQYDDHYFLEFNPARSFEKWAAIEVTDFDLIPEGMVALTLSSGLYAVFAYKGPSSRGPQIFQYIFGTWLPSSEYQLDNRLHFEVLGEKYKNDDPESEEEIWIPIRCRE